MSRYEISKSSLLSLKAEILRKQDEVNKVKLENKQKLSKKASHLDLKSDKKKSLQTDASAEREYNSEDEDLLRKSRAALEAKTKLYDKLSKTGDKRADDDIPSQYLVCFDKKSVQSNNNVDYLSEEEEIRDDYEPAQNSDEEWVEYTDCLGRSRKCLRKDLEYLKKVDSDLKLSVEKKKQAQNFTDTQEQNIIKTDKEKNAVLSEETEKAQAELLSSDMRREELRKQWEKEEEELMKRKDVHYQNVLFGEARTHGVGYYAFSKDEEERAQQQEGLRKLREETQQKQKKAQELKAMREQQLAARTKAARNRKRTRMGLPPEEDNPEPTKPEEEKPMEESKKQLKEVTEEEKSKENARKSHVRPWDVGKKGVKEFYEYSQEEWVEKQRRERINEFAPPSAYGRNSSKEGYSSKELYDSKEGYSLKEPYGSKKGYSSKEVDDLEDGYSSKEPYGSKKGYSSKEESSKHRKEVFKRRNEQESESSDEDDSNSESDRLMQDYKSMFDDKKEKVKSNTKNSTRYTPIVNECSSDEEREDMVKKNVNRYRDYASIPPPDSLTRDSGSSKPKKRQKLDTEDSIMAGLQFLRKQVEKKQKSKQHPEEMFLM